ncbi:MAG: glycosyltransferase family 2 protein [Candidatus Calescibacterium sp.]|nr:glycosyltransferase family 2 protein [Candidatus Calescibacterium sp.]MDW8133341.1 glycosyltransferase family 2 protein [Candidatus Calescibacterium sp.]
MDTPKVSIIIRAFNADDYLADALESVVNQTFSEPMEVLVLYDKGSTTKRAVEITINYIKNNKNDFIEIKLIEHEHVTPFRAYNLGLNLATGEYTCFLDYDNIYEKNFIEYLYKNLKKGFNLVYTYATFLDENLNFLEIQKNYSLLFKLARIFLNPPEYLDTKKLLVYNYIDASSFMFDGKCKRILIEKFDKLKHRYFDWVYEDWLSALILAKEGVKSKLVKDVTYYYRIHEKNITMSYQKRDFPKELTHLEREIKTLKTFEFIYKNSLTLTEKLLLKLMLIRKLFKTVTF